MSIRILDRYIAKNVLAATGLVTLMLTGLQLFILFVSQLGDLGKMDYGIKQATIFVLLQTPYQLYLFFPVASLIGCLSGLSLMASHSELIVMRAAGMSIMQITGAVLKASFVIIVLVTFLGETVVPVMSHSANDIKNTALSGGQSIRTAEGLWLRFGNDFISIGTVTSENTLQDVHQFHFDAQHNLLFARAILDVKLVDNQWVAYGVQQTVFGADRTKAEFFKSMPWEIYIRPQILKISSHEADEMTLHELNRFLREQKRNQQNAQSYQLAFLQRLVQPFTTLVMMLLAIPFIFGPLRSSTIGSKLVAGIGVGFGFHIVNRFLGPISIVYQWPPALAAFGPTILFALLGLYLMRQVK